MTKRAMRRTTPSASFVRISSGFVAAVCAVLAAAVWLAAQSPAPSMELVVGRNVNMGKHHKALQAGYTVTVHKSDGTTVVKDVAPKEGAVVLEPEVRAYFPDSESVNRALRCLIPLLSKKRMTKAKKA